MSIEAATDLGIARALINDSLPSATQVLAVTARPVQESAELGGLLYAFRRSGAALSLLCMTRGEAAAANAGTARLEAARPWEVQMAASVLGVAHVAVASFRDGHLHHYPASRLVERIRQSIIEYRADLVLVVAPETGDISDSAVARASTAAALLTGVPVAARTKPGVSGGWALDLGTDAELARAIQKSAAAAHRSQSETFAEMINRIDRFGHAETLRWLLSLARVPAQRTGQ